MRCYSIGFHVGLPKGLKQLLEKHLSGILCLDGQDPFAYTTHTFIYIYIYLFRSHACCTILYMTCT